MKFSPAEKRDLLKAWFVVALVFAISDTGLSLTALFFLKLVITGFTAGLGFLIHEIAHKLVAVHFKCRAEFHSFDQMLLLSILLSFLGFVFIAPGAVIIFGARSKAHEGKISAAGVVANLLLALLFLVLMFTPLQPIAHYGLAINTWLAVFNLIPLGNFDGLKIFNWSKKAYVALLLFAGIMTQLPLFI
ncbi:MAG: hypothetical protein ABIG95_00135 [Candidatus Woesearchaeota archaeon]